MTSWQPLCKIGGTVNIDGKDIKYEDAVKELPAVNCNCGFRGSVLELLEDKNNDSSSSTMKCPQCTSSGWIYD